MKPAVVSLPTESRVRVVRAELRRRILSWEYGPGARLMEEEISGEFGVSRTVLREALSQLEASGLVRKVRNKGYTVSQPDLREVRELYEVREALELHVAEQLCRQGVSPELAERLYAIWDGPMPADAEQAELLADRDREFHEGIFEAYGNEALLSRLKNINDRIEAVRRVDFSQGESAESIRDHHHVIVRAFVEGDVDKARAAMRDNIRHAEAHVETGLKEMLMHAFVHSKRDAGDRP
jgi:DNA-binding GntR family transcriptional regulator